MCVCVCVCVCVGEGRGAVERVSVAKQASLSPVVALELS